MGTTLPEQLFHSLLAGAGHAGEVWPPATLSRHEEDSKHEDSQRWNRPRAVLVDGRAASMVATGADRRRLPPECAVLSLPSRQFFLSGLGNDQGVCADDLIGDVGESYLDTIAKG
jgi:hypothetical protein